MAIQHLGSDVLLSRTDSGPIRSWKSERPGARMLRDDLVMFCVHLSGRARVRQYDRVADLGAGSAVVYEAFKPWDLEYASDVRSVNLRFPREMLPMRSTRFSEWCARTMDPASPALHLFRDYVGRLTEIGEAFTSEQRHDAGHAAIDLLTMALRGMKPSVPADEGPGEVLLAMMRSYVSDHLADSSLNATELTRRHHISVRQAYALFARSGTTPGAYIREQRLAAARAMLADLRYASWPMSQVAAAVGYIELRTFERAFTRLFHTTPARWRRDYHADPHDRSQRSGS